MDDFRSSIPPPLPPKTRKGGAKYAQRQQQVANTTTVNGCTSYPSVCGANQGSGQSAPGEHVVKIHISPGDTDYSPLPSDGSIHISVGADRPEDMVRRGASSLALAPDRNNSPYFYYSTFQCQANGMGISSGQSSPSDTLDSGTCSDLDGSTPPPPPKKTSAAARASPGTVTVTVNGNHQHRRTGSLTSSGAEVDSDDDVGSNISCDSLNGHELNGVATNGTSHETSFQKVLESDESSECEKIRSKTPPPTPMKSFLHNTNSVFEKSLFPQGLLQDIRDRSPKLAIVPGNNTTGKKYWLDEGVSKREAQRPNSTTPEPKEVVYQKQQSSLYRLQQAWSPPPPVEEPPARKSLGLVQERTYEERVEASRRSATMSPEPAFDTDRFYEFHMREREPEPPTMSPVLSPEDEETFAGLRDLLSNKDASATIRSAKGTVRGVKNRVRAGIATFLQFPDTKSYKEKEAGKVVLYTTTMGIVRQTFQECLKVKKILRTLLVKYEERDVFMSREVQAEIQERMHSDSILVPQLFLEGQHIGDAETIERLNECGELRKLLKSFKNPDACTTCPVCGGFRLLPCSVCNGSKKSVHRNDFTAEFVSLKCMNCDEVGLVRCYAC